MDVNEAIETRIEIREYSEKEVDGKVKKAILEAGRLAPSGKNLQHWRFILVEDDLDQIAELSPSGSWIANSDFAIVVCTDPTYGPHEIDAGRAITHMQLSAWEKGIGSCIYTVDQPELNELLEIPDEFALTLVGGFGYPRQEVNGLKNRKSLSDVAYSSRFGNTLEF